MAKPAQILNQSVLQSAVGQLSPGFHFWHLAAMASMPSVCQGLADGESKLSPAFPECPGMVSGCLVPSE